jgi:hypothetical protein
MNILITSRDYNRESGRCVYKFPSTTTISGKEVALLGAKFNNSFFNISTALGNNIIEVKIPLYSSADTLAAIPYKYIRIGDQTTGLADGFYSFEDLNLVLQDTFIREKCYLYDPASGKNVYFAALRVNPVQYLLQLDNYFTPTQEHLNVTGWTLPAGAPSFVNPLVGQLGPTRMIRTQFVIQTGSSAMMGIPAGVYPVDNGASTTPYPAYMAYADYGVASTMGAVAPEVQSTTGVVVRASIVSSPTAYPVDMLALIPVTSVFGAVVNYEANFPMFVSTASGTISGIELSFTDQNFNPIKFFDPDVSFTLYIRNKT